MKHSNTHITGIPQTEEEQGIENLFEKLITENFLNLKRENFMQVQEAQRVPIKVNPNRPTPRHIIIKMQNLKTILKI